jgi:hypothetical protein
VTSREQVQQAVLGDEAARKGYRFSREGTSSPSTPSGATHRKSGAACAIPSGNNVCNVLVCEVLPADLAMAPVYTTGLCHLRYALGFRPIAQVERDDSKETRRNSPMSKCLRPTTACSLLHASRSLLLGSDSVFPLFHAVTMRSQSRPPLARAVQTTALLSTCITGRSRIEVSVAHIYHPRHPLAARNSNPRQIRRKGAQILLARSKAKVQG